MAGPVPEPKKTTAVPVSKPAAAPSGGGRTPLKRELAQSDYAAGTERVRPEDGPPASHTLASTPDGDSELARRTRITTGEILFQAEGFALRLQTLVDQFTVPPTLAQMQQVDELLISFEEEIGRWRVLAFQVDERLLAGDTANWSGPDSFDDILREMRTAFQAAVKTFQQGVATRNGAEIRREADLAQKPTPKKGERDERLRTDAGEHALGDRDWLPLFVPGIRVKRNALKTTKATRDRARRPEEIRSAVIHTGAKTNQATLNALSGGGLAGHFSVDGGGDTEQMSPVSQIGAHAEVANRTSIAIDLAYGHGAKAGANAQIAFLSSAAQMVNAARILVAQDSVSPSVVGRTNTRGKLLGEHLGAVDEMTGAYGGVAEFADSERLGVATSIEGIVAHKDLPDGDHADPGEAYMQRLQAFVPVLAEYERRYGPIDIHDASELERVVTVIERYEESTGRAAAGISLRELRLRIERKVANATEGKSKGLSEDEMQVLHAQAYRELIGSGETERGGER